MPSRLAALAALAVIAPLAPALSATAPAVARPAATTAASAAGPLAEGGYDATIRRTEHGIPHITASDWGSLGFGSGYVAAQDSTCTLAETLLTARAQRSRWFGADGTWDDRTTPAASNLKIDAFVTDLRDREVVETLLEDPVAGPSKRARELVEGYTAGINDYLAEVGPDGVTDPQCAGAGYLVPDVEPVDLWYGVYLANLIASSGRFVNEIVDAEPPAGAARAEAPAVPELGDVDADEVRRALGHDPEASFGSNATAIGSKASTTRRGMVLGNPHFPWTGRYRFTQQHLTIPGKYDVAGASLIGSPAINIGWNRDVAWSHTVSTAYRFTPYQFPTPTPTTYETESGPRPVERREVEVTVLLEDGSLGTVTEDLYRTSVGYVLHAPKMLMSWTPSSLWAIRDANGEHLRTIDTFFNMGFAKGVRALLRRQDNGGGMPWVNTTAADRDGRVLYADHSVVPNVPDAMAKNCMTPTGALIASFSGLPGLDGTRAEGECAWRTDAGTRPGVFGPENLPAVVRRDWVMNANDSYWTPNDRVRLEGYAGIIGCEQCGRTMRTRMVSRYVTDRLDRRRESPRSLRGHQHENRVMAAEVTRRGGALDRVCAATGETDACAVLAAWDGRSDADSVGAHLFEEFYSRLPATGVWRVPFDAERPLATPRGLDAANPNVVQAMTDAIASLRERDVALDAPWGSLQVPGDRGAEAFPLGGGSGPAGNANALTSRWTDTEAGWRKEVLAGSSHIQAISFLDRGGLDARTILTYGQREDPTSPWSQDQTELFSAERWVSFPWTDAQIEAALVEEYAVSGG
ncbi:penicillin acylase family protein [Nocardioides ferulae]|uniref:penicillin acylase family protein n=1 Tax=Nocardioides ferulae TaxID=2340821 RepID=UPI001F0BAD73|nr:penicillin acylase family protein [Nocardioides ferulae]